MLVRSVKYRESEWSVSDVAALVAIREKRRVGPHGQPMSEATSRQADPANPQRTIDYDVEVWTDFAAKRLADEKKRYKDQYGDDVNMDELVFLLNKVER